MLLEGGVGLLRLDCGPKATGLCGYYEAYGFRRVGLATAHGFEAALYEKDLGIDQRHLARNDLMIP